MQPDKITTLLNTISKAFNNFSKEEQLAFNRLWLTITNPVLQYNSQQDLDKPPKINYV